MKIVGFPVDVSRSHDGRIVRGLRTRQALIQATLDLIQAGDVEPTSAAIATIAETSVASAESPPSSALTKATSAPPARVTQMAAPRPRNSPVASRLTDRPGIVTRTQRSAAMGRPEPPSTVVEVAPVPRPV